MNKKWWKEAVVYQIYPKSFKDSNDDGIGDIKGITEKLDYLCNLGINTLWICPFYKSPMVDNGYDISDYYNIDSIFGCNDDMTELLQKASEKGIRVLADLVVNHTSDQHEWFQKALADKNSKYRGYYIFKEGNGGQAPTNWRSNFGGDVWQKVEDNVFYYHTFAKEQPDLNWENEELRKEVYNIVNYWIDKGISGFRIDAITFIKKDQNYTMLSPDGKDGLVALDTVARNHPGIQDFLKELKVNTFDKGEYMTVAEAPGVPYSELEEFIGEDGDFSMIFDFSYNDIDLDKSGNWYVDKEWSIKEFRDAIYKSQLEFQKVGWGALYMENHDQPRSINKFIPEGEISYESATALASMYFFLRGTPFIYQGEELGMTNYEFTTAIETEDVASIDQYERAINAGLSHEAAMQAINRHSRGNSRTPMQWNSGIYAGFSNVEPWMPVNGNSSTVNAEYEIKSKNSIFHFYQTIIELRNKSKYRDVFIYGSFSPVLTEYDDMVCYERTYEQTSVTVIVNFGNERTITDKYGKIIINNYRTTIREKNNLYLRPYECIIIENVR